MQPHRCEECLQPDVLTNIKCWLFCIAILIHKNNTSFGWSLLFISLLTSNVNYSLHVYCLWIFSLENISFFYVYACTCMSMYMCLCALVIVNALHVGKVTLICTMQITFPLCFMSFILVFNIFLFLTDYFFHSYLISFKISFILWENIMAVYTFKIFMLLFF